MQLFFKYLSVSWAFLAAFVCVSFAEGEEPRRIDRKEVIRIAQEVSSESYPNAEEVLVDEQNTIYYQADGTYTQWSEVFIKVLTEEARRNRGTLSTYFTIPYQRGPEDCRIDLVEIIKPDGTMIQIDVDGQSKVMVNPGSMSANIYNPNDKLIAVNVAGVDVGDILHYVLFDRIVQPRMTNTWCDWLSFESTLPIVRKSTEVHAPLTQPLRMTALKDPVSSTLTERIVTNENEVVYSWTVRDVPRMFPEPNMPPAHTVLQRQLISTVPNWETISRWYWDLSEPHFETTPEIREKVKELIAGTDDPQQQIENLFKFVSQQIRYMGITVEATAPGYEPHDVADTFAARHGVCRDKAALLVAMLREAGFDAFPTLIHTGAKKDPEVPQPYFNHAIVAVRNADGHYQLMDPTDENTRQLLPAYLNDKSYLVATPEGEQLLTSPFIPASKNMMHIKTDGMIGADGQLSATTLLQFDGVNDNAYRGMFSRRTPEERTRFIEGLIKTVIPDAKISKIRVLPEDMMNTSEPLSISISYTADNILIRGRDTSLLPLPWFGTSVGMVNYILGQTGLQKRKYPLKTDIACGVEERVTLNMPNTLANIQVFPDYEPVETDGIVWDVTCEQTGSTIHATAEFVLNQTQYSPEEYLAFKETLKKTERDARKKTIINTPAGYSVQPDSRVLDVDVQYNITDQHTWTQTRTIKREILTYAGKKKHGELKLKYNPAWESLELVYGKVTNPDGSTHEISQQEINIMDAPWAGSARRYPAGKTLVASFPAVEEGSVIEFRIVHSYSNRPFFSAREYFRAFAPIQKKTVTMKFPEKTTPVVVATQAEVLHQGWGTPPGSSYACSIENSPPVKREDLLPPWHTFNPTLFVSLGDWPHYAQTVHDYLLRASADQLQTEKLARELINGIDDPWEQIRVIRDYVAIHIRKVGPALPNLPLSAITPSDQTLSDAYGNSTDTAVLLYAMLRAVGFEPEFVLASRQPDLDAVIQPVTTAPQRSLFSTLLVRIDDTLSGLSSDAALYLNSGNQYSELGTSRFEDNVCLNLPEGTFATITPAKKAKEHFTYTLRPSVDGHMQIIIRDLLFGAAFGAKNQLFAEMPPEDRRRYYEELVGGVSQAATAASDLVTDFTSYPGRIEFMVNIPKYAVAAGAYLYFNLPRSLNNLFQLRTDFRDNPLFIRRVRRLEVQNIIELPAGFTVESSPEIMNRTNVANAPISIKVESEMRSDTQPLEYRIVSQADLKPAIIQPGNYNQLLQLNRQLSSEQNDTLVLRQEQISDEQ